MLLWSTSLGFAAAGVTQLGRVVAIHFHGHCKLSMVCNGHKSWVCRRLHMPGRCGHCTRCESFAEQKPKLTPAAFTAWPFVFMRGFGGQGLGSIVTDMCSLDCLVGMGLLALMDLTRPAGWAGLAG